MKRIRDGDLAMGHARKPQEDQCFLINNHFDRYSAITSASHHASIEFFGPLVLRRKICALCGHGDFRDIQVAKDIGKVFPFHPELAVEGQLVFL